MKAVPRNDNIFVIPFEPPKETEGGIVLPEFSRRRSCEGIVVALGPDVKDELITKGSRIMYGPYAAHHLRVPVDFFGEEKEAYIMNEADIIAVLYEKETNSNHSGV